MGLGKVPIAVGHRAGERAFPSLALARLAVQSGGIARHRFAPRARVRCRAPEQTDDALPAPVDDPRALDASAPYPPSGAGA